MTEKKAACLIYGPMIHHLDHLVPICELLAIPLIVTEEQVYASAKKFYSFIKIHFWDYTEVSEKLIGTFDIIISSLPRLTFEEIFFFTQHFMKKKLHTIWCPHGNSDKGHHSIFMEALDKEEVALVYGKKMIDFLIEKKAFHQLKASVQMGNLRYTHYLNHKQYYAHLVKHFILRKLPKNMRTLLYAPTWKDTEKNGTFFEAAPQMIEHLPDHWNLIIKIHPNTAQQDDIKLDLFMEKHQDKPNLLFLIDFPPIYPLLDSIDIYIGDMSSIGYDFLTFRKPMYFLNQQERDPKSDPGLYLLRCGPVITPKDYDSIYSMIEKSLPMDTELFSEERKETYAYTYGQMKDDKSLKKEILDTFSIFPDSDLPQL